jgi:hypothetical protein
MFRLFADRGLEFVDASEDAATDTLLGDRSEAVLDLVEPRSQSCQDIGEGPACKASGPLTLITQRRGGGGRPRPMPAALSGACSVPKSVPGATIASIRSRISSLRTTSAPSSRSSSCCIVRGPRLANGNAVVGGEGQRCVPPTLLAQADDVTE